MLGFKKRLGKSSLEPCNAVKTAMSDNSTTKSLERPHQIFCAACDILSSLCAYLFTLLGSGFKKRQGKAEIGNQPAYGGSCTAQ
jgi:hypothetical protein